MKSQEILTEAQLEAIFRGQNIRTQPKLRSYLIFFLLLFLISAGIFTAINFGAIKGQLGYFFKNEFGQADTSADNNNTPIIISNPNTNITKIRFPQIENNHLNIASLNLNIPIIWRVPNDPDSVKSNLQNGVAHIDGTAMPGEKGNVFITGHSSNYSWAKGDYNSVFALLNNLVVGDSIQLKYQDINYLYTVSEKKIVSDDDLSIMDQTNKPILTLMTCWPIGTAYKRLAIIANQTYPDPKENQLQKNKKDSSKLPNVH